MTDETKKALRKVLSIIDAECEHCDERMEAAASVRESRNLWACCAITCEVLAERIEKELEK